MFRILSVNKKGNKGTDVTVTYYDTQALKPLEKQGSWRHITPSREIVPEKHGYTWERLQSELIHMYPNESFEMQPYHRSASEESMQYRHGQNSFIAWHRGARETMHDLEFFIDEKSTKQIFIRNPRNRFRARTVLAPQQIVERYVGNARKSIGDRDAEAEVKQQYDNAYAEIKCTEQQLKKLNPLEFRIIEYGAEKRFEEHEAQQDLNGLLSDPAVAGIIDRRVIKETRDERDRKRYQAIASASLDKRSQAILMRHMFKTQKDEYGVYRRMTSQELWDPLLINSPAEQLRWFFPSQMPYDPDKPLEQQACFNVNPFTMSELESAVNDAYAFYTENSAIVDIETTAYTKGTLNTGRISMVVLDELKKSGETVLYMTMEAAKDKRYMEKLQQQFRGARLVLVADEVEAIAKVSDRLEQYVHVFGHNIEQFDYFHLSKFNEIEKHARKSSKQEQTELFVGKEDGFQYDSVTAEGLAARTRQERKDKAGNKQKLFDVKRLDVLDTYTYLQRRVSLLGNHKLESFGGFRKIMDYETLERLTQSSEYEDKVRMLKYVLEDGEKTKEVVRLILYNAIVEGMASSSSLRTVFSSVPRKNFHDAGARRYFMKLHTFRDRHESNVKDNIEKLRERDDPEQIMLDFLKAKGMDRQQFGEIRGSLYYPTAIIDAFREIIENNPALRFLYSKLEAEKDEVLMEDWISKVSFALTVPIDKVANFMEGRGFKFGVEYAPEQVFPALKAQTIEEFDAEFNRKFEGTQLDLFSTQEGYSQFDMSEASFIYWNEYGVRKQEITRAYENPLTGKAEHRDVDVTMLGLNNVVARNLAAMRQKGYIGRTPKFVVSAEPLGIKIGDVRGLNMYGERMFGEILSEQGPVRFVQGFRKRKEGLEAEIMEDWHSEQRNREPLRQRVAELASQGKLPDLLSQLSTHALGYDPSTTKPTMADDIQGKLFK